MQVPYLFERVVIADRKAAVAEPPFASAFELEEPSEHWWEPIRRNVALHFDAYGGSKGKKMNAGKIVTYVHNNDGGGGGLRLRNSDHNALVKALNDMQRDYGYEVHIVSSNDLYTKWQDRMGAVVRSTVRSFHLSGVYAFIDLITGGTGYDRTPRLQSRRKRIPESVSSDDSHGILPR